MTLPSRHAPTLARPHQGAFHMAVINLNKPLEDVVISNQEKGFMKNLQANILKGHGREHVVLLFMAVKNVADARSFLHSYPATDSFTQLQDTINFKKQRIRGGVIRLVFLSQTGLAKFGHASQFSSFNAFAGGMAADTAVLDGGTIGSWQEELKRPIDVMLLIAYHNKTDLAAMVGTMVQTFETPPSPF